MSWNLKKKAQALLAEEQGTFHKEWGGKVAIALVYPNTYAVGMSNLGFQTIYWHLNRLLGDLRGRLHQHVEAASPRRHSAPRRRAEAGRPARADGRCLRVLEPGADGALHGLRRRRRRRGAGARAHRALS